jgi:glycosyltransferase involved in cell wall biosynthesis
MVQLVLALLREDELRQKVSRKARDHAVNNFSRERIVKEYIEVYHRVLEGTS